MGIFCHEEPPNSSKKCAFLASALKDVFSNCHTFNEQLSPSKEEEYPASDYEDDQEVVVSVIRSRAMEAKLRRKSSFSTDGFSWDFSPAVGELFITSKAVQQKQDDDDDDAAEFFSVGSCLSRCSSAASGEAFLSVKTNFSRCSSLNGLDFQDFPRRSIIQELCHCEGWPFGLCRKALLLPPLPKSPSESWSWRSKGSKVTKIP